MKKEKRVPFSRKELNSIFKIDDTRLAEVYYYTGIRRNEIYELFHSFLENNNNQYLIIKSLKKKENLKTNDKSRVIPLNDKIIASISQAIKYWHNKGVKSINNHFKKLSDKLEFKIYPHRFRHTFATNLIENGIGIIAVKELLGHSKLETTAIYIKSSPSVLKNAINMLSNPKYSIDGMSMEEMKQEIIRLRSRYERFNNE